MPWRSRKSNRVRKSSKFVRSRVSTSRFKSRRSSRFGARSFRRGMVRRGFRGGKHKRLSKQTIKSFFPDIAKSIMKGYHIWTGIPCNDLSTALAFLQGTTTSNTFSVRMNANPNGGGFYAQPGTDTFSVDTLNPVATYLGRYNKYRPMGCKISVKIFSQDNGVANPTGGVANVQIATPFMLYGFPFVFNATTPAVEAYANWWPGTPSNSFTASNVPQLKYGFSRESPGQGGDAMVKYSTYWDFAKILGLTRQQYLSEEIFTCQPDDNSSNPAVGVYLALALADYTPALARQCTVHIKIKQYGRWEGQQLLYQ